MKTIDSAPDKIKKICAVLREETLQPAMKEAEAILQAAEERASKIIEEAKLMASNIQKAAKEAIEKEQLLFNANLQQAIKQGLEALRQTIEERFFHRHLSTLLEKETVDPRTLSTLLAVVIEAIKKEGLSADLAAYVPKTVAPRDVNALLLKEMLQELQGASVSVGEFSGGIQVKLVDNRVTLDISDQALKELLATYVVRNDFRRMIFVH